MDEDYKWVIVYDRITGMYTLTGYIKVDGKWSGPDGAPLQWAYLDAPLEHIKKHVSRAEDDESRRRLSDDK